MSFRLPAWLSLRNKAPRGPSSQLPEATEKSTQSRFFPFDELFYRSQTDLPLSENAFEHYVSVGDAHGLRPHPLFDSRFYAGQLAGKRPAGKTLLEHYLECGEEQGLNPHPLFDIRFYKKQLGADQLRESALAHYLTEGFKCGLQPHPTFDPNYYWTTNPDVRALQVEPLCHYIRCGDSEGRKPNPYFDTVYYRQYCGQLSQYETSLEHYLQYGRNDRMRPNRAFDQEFYLCQSPDAQDYEYGPFAHYCQIGAKENRPAVPPGIAMSNPLDDEEFGLGQETASSPEAPSPNQWQELAAGLARQTDANARNNDSSSENCLAVSVIIPVYRDTELTLACIYSVLKAQSKLPYQLIVIDDASPEPELSFELDLLAKLQLFKLIRNEENLGFVRSVNKGFAACSSTDIILLNSDTIVFDGWLDRLMAATHSHPKIGTVTPFSNNAIICSYPKFLYDNDKKLEIEYRDLDVLVARLHAGITVDIPTAVGFCMLIKRECLADVGKFDEEAFGKGYGEENDFCLRAAARGWRNVLAADTFVRHVGSVSFGAEKNIHLEHGEQVIRERYPFYEKLIDNFCKTDPIAPLRRRIDLARAVPEKFCRSILLFGHRLGGGVERHILDLAQRWEALGVRAFIIRPARKAADVTEIYSLDTGLLPNITIDLGATWTQTEELLKALKVGHIHFNQLACYGAKMKDWVQMVSDNCDVPMDFSTHDYAVICPRANFIDGTGIYCREPNEESCQTCIDTNGSAYGRVNIKTWRADAQIMLGKMRAVITQNPDVLERFAARFDGLNLLMQPYPENLPAVPLPFRQRDIGEPLKVAIIGALAANKGKDIVIACAKDAFKRKLPLNFVIVGGSTDEAVLGKLPNVSITGPYQEDKVMDVIKRIGCHASFFASNWPETFSYTLSIAMCANLYPFAFDLGAIANRLKKINWGSLFPIDWMTQAVQINDQILSTQLVSLEAVHGENYGALAQEYYRLPPGFIQQSWQDLYRAEPGKSELAQYGSEQVAVSNASAKANLSSRVEVTL